MPRMVESVGGRVLILGTLAAVTITFTLWFLSKGPLFGSAQTSSARPARTRDSREPRRPQAPNEPARYPSLQQDIADGGLSYGAEPDFDPLGAPLPARKNARGLLELLGTIPDGHSVLGILDLARLRKHPWAASILARRRLPRLRGYLDRIGFDPTEARHVAFGVDLETRAAASRGDDDPRFLQSHYDRPFSLIATGKLARRALLRRFRAPGPLAATMVMGRRVYRRAGDFGLSFPARQVVVWSYRRPMGPLLQLLLEDASRSALTPARRKVLREVGLRLSPPAPLVALAWTPQPRRRIPWPFNRLGGASLRGAVLVVRAKDLLLVAELTLLFTDLRTAQRIATLLRYVRLIVGQRPDLRRSLLKPVLDAVPIRLQGTNLRITAEIRPWHARALMAVLHKLIEK